MFNEIEAAVARVAALIPTRSEESGQHAAPSSIETFTDSLRARLRARCEGCWYANDAERGSASRAIVWQLHSAGEGPDLAILDACRSVLESHAEEGEIVAGGPHQGALDLARQWFRTPFTLWLDPDCVAIRMGSGPGVVPSQFDIEARSACSSAISVVWGKLLTQHGDNQRPAVTVTSAVAPCESRAIQIVRPESRYPSSLASGSVAVHRARHDSTSSCGSSIAGLSRSVSMSSNASLSTDATSYASEEESDACPSLVSPWSTASSSSSSLSSSSSSPRSASEVEGEQADATICRTPFKGAILFYGDDSDDAAGDCTMVLEQGAEIVSTPRNTNVGEDGRQQRLRHGSVSSSVANEEGGQVKSNYTIHDNGNVGVLGGGVRLGGARPAASSSTTVGGAAAHRLRQHVSSKSVSSVYAPHLSMRDMRKHNPFFTTAATYSAPSHSIPLPPVSGPVYGSHGAGYGPRQNAHPHPHHANLVHGYAPGVSHLGPAFMGQFGGVGVGVGGFSGYLAAAMPNGPPRGYYQGGYESNVIHLSGGLDGANLRPKLVHGHGHSSSVTFAPCTLGYDHPDCSDETSNRGGEEGRRRVRSRGRRSRGRGAGRAARRQAAALKPLQEGGQAELNHITQGGGLGLDVDGETSDAAFSRCSTPDASEFGTSGCYSSAASSPSEPALLNVNDKTMLPSEIQTSALHLIGAGKWSEPAGQSMVPFAM